MSGHTHTHTYATMEVSLRAYSEIATQLKKAGYPHSFIGDGVIDMYGIGLVAAPDPRTLAGGDPTYNRTEINANPKWRLAFVLSEIQNDGAPIGWGKYIWIAECLLSAFDVRAKDADISHRDAEIVRTLASALKKILPRAELDRIVALIDPHKPLEDFVAFLRDETKASAPVSRSKAACNRKRSSMTPCVVEDGGIAEDSTGACVGCGFSPDRLGATS